MITESKDFFLGLVWVGLGTLLVLYFYNLHFFYKPKVLNEDRHEYKQVYKFMDKHQRPIAILGLFYGIVSFIIINEFFDKALVLLAKGICMLIIIGPLMH